MKISNNILALQTQLSLSRTEKNIFKSSSRLNSGLKINSSADDSAGMALSNSMKSQIKSLEMANRNSLDGISLIQTAEGALSQVHSMLQRMRELAVQSSNGTMVAADREKVQLEIDSIKEEITSLSTKTQFNNIKLIGGEASRLSKTNNELMATTSSISTTVSPGTLTYSIESIGLPAKVTASANPITATVDGSLTINGESIKIYADDSSEAILDKIRKVCGYSNIDVIVDATDINLVTKEAGSKKEITISCSDPDLLYDLGFSEGTVNGIDAVVTNVEFLNSNLEPDSAFNNSISIISDGNRVEVSSSDNKKIIIDIKLKVNDDASFETNEGAQVADDGGIVTEDMECNILDYGPIILQIGPNKSMELILQIPEVTSRSLGIENMNYMSIFGANEAIKKCDSAIAEVSNIRSMLGAHQNRLEFTSSSLDVTSDNAKLSLSRILDTDMAKEMTSYTKFNVLSQAATSILAQANQRPQQILQLLK